MTTSNGTRNGPLRVRFRVPDYYPAFRCKASACRSTCCAGWDVTVPFGEYVSLTGIACDDRLKARIDRAFVPLAGATPERYAVISRTFEDRCPLLDAEGLCGLHAACGESALPSVCRLYPRSVRIAPVAEAACANSCERTLELLFADHAPIRFLEVDGDGSRGSSFRSSDAAVPGRYRRIKDLLIAILSDRSYPLPHRIRIAGRMLETLDRDPEADLEAIDRSLEPILPDPAFALGVLASLLRRLAVHAPAIAAFCQEAGEPLTAAVDAYLSAKERFETRFPDHEVRFEKMLVNELAFREFPPVNPTGRLADEGIALAGTYAFLRFYAIATMAKAEGETAFVDAMAKIFRVVSHTRFGRNIAVHLQREDAADARSLGRLVLV